MAHDRRRQDWIRERGREGMAVLAAMMSMFGIQNRLRRERG